ncbi:hypothetical protein V6N12_069789 [Hibiscus sabdariffa]|uniref:Uncharacterized protein n=1 Tax=Hibiscus sabdariffa TaxID=183260 RepID=A0ABR2FEV2_9ROSI
MTPPTSSENLHLPKRQRRRDEALPDHQPCLALLSPPLLNHDPNNDSPAMQTDPPSYRDKVTGFSSPRRDDDLLSLEDDDIELLEDDVMFGEKEGIPSIVFSDRVQSLALKSMDLTLVIKILRPRPTPESTK